MPKPNVTILGAGNIGQAIARLIKPKAKTVWLWDKDPVKVPQTPQLSEIIPQSNVVFLCVPSAAIREVLMSLKPYLNKLRQKTVIISLSKGLEAKTFLTVDMVIKQSLPAGQPFGLLSGPMLAEELNQDMGGGAIVASKDISVYKELKKLLPVSVVAEHSSDTYGAALAGVLKNVYAIAIGLADGLAYGSNKKGLIASYAIREMMAIFTLLKAKPETLLGPAGLADFLATAYSPYSRNRSEGDELAHHLNRHLHGEGAASIGSLEKLVKKQLPNLPLLASLIAIIKKGKNPKTIMTNFCRKYV